MTTDKDYEEKLGTLIPKLRPNDYIEYQEIYNKQGPQKAYKYIKQLLENIPQRKTR